MMNELVKVENGKIEVAKEVVKQIIDFQKIKLEMDLKEKELKKVLKEKMEECGITKWSTDGLCATITSATTRTTLDSKKLKEELPDIYDEYSKTSNVSSSIRLIIGE